MQPLVGLGDLVDDQAAGGDGPLAPLEVAVERHHDRHPARAGQEIETGHSGFLIDDPAGHVGPGLDLNVARNHQGQLGGRRTRQLQGEDLGGRRGFQRGDHLQHQLVPALALDEQHERSPSPSGRGLG